MFAMMISPFGLNKVAPVRPCCDPSGGGWAGRTAQRSQQRGEPGSEKNLSREECAQRRGKLFSLEGCGHEAQPPPGFTTTQGRTGRPLPNGDMADSASPRDGFTGLRPDTGKDNAPTTRPEAPLPLLIGSRSSRDSMFGKSTAYLSCLIIEAPIFPN
jgi:hypothetical protein